jgi:DNA-binding LacI/PurR family transcriptional regulator
MKKSVAVLAPEAIPVDGSQSRAGWLKFVTMGTVESLRSAGLHALTLSVSELTEEDVVKLAEARPRGFLVPDLGVPVEKLAGWIKVFQSANVPVVAYGGHDAFGDVDRVVSDHEQGSYDLTRALIARGHRRLVQVWPKPWETYWFAARQRGYERAMREAGLGAEATAEFPRLPFFAKDAEGFEYCVKLVVGFLMGLGLEKGCNAALMAATDRDVFFMTAALRRMGLKSGVDAVVAGYDGYAARCIEWQWEDCGPVLSVDKENERLGEVMVGLLEDRIAGRLGQEPAVRQLGQRVLEGSELGPKAWS